MIDLKTYNFPKVNNSDLIFSTLDTIPELLEEAKKRGFYNNHQNIFVKHFNTLFFNGGKLVFKTGLDKMFLINTNAYLRSFMRSFEPKHEDKQAICSMLLSELIETVETN